ncbi:MAG: iron ABC transporter permease, partial [Mangrovicoccus sp.]|nr:iron ABC transporter permease [Mangrovicoccus sp.]
MGAIAAQFNRTGVNVWSAGALLIAAVVLTPILSVAWLAMAPSHGVWGHLAATTLPRYLGNTLLLMLSVGAITASVGTTAAWLVTQYRFPGVRGLEWLLLLPLAIPAYIGAYAVTDLLDYAGPVQTLLRATFGWQSARDYWFPEVRSRWAAIIVLSAALCPYVYLMARAAFREQSVCAHEVARTLGAGPWRRFSAIALPLARPAIAAGAAVAMMETAADFGVVDFFAVQTLTTGIFTTWLQAANAAGAAQIAGLVLLLVFGLTGLEKASRRRMRFYRTSRRQRPMEKVTLRGAWAWAAAAFCLVPVLVGFVLPVSVIGTLAVGNAAEWADPALLMALGHTLLVAGTAAFVTVALALFMVYGVRLSGHSLPRALLPVTTLGYAAPGAVLGLGLLIPLGALDNRLADL